MDAVKSGSKLNFQASMDKVAEFLIKKSYSSTKFHLISFHGERAQNLLAAKINYRLILINYKAKRAKRNHLNLMEIL